MNGKDIMINKNKKNSGFLLVELIVSLSILGILLVVLALSLDVFRRLNHYSLTRQRCTASAQAQLDSIAVMGEAISDEDFKRLWPEQSVTIEKSAGTEQWEGLTLLKVKTRAKSFNKDVKVELCRYVLDSTRQ